MLFKFLSLQLVTLSASRKASEFHKDIYTFTFTITSHVIGVYDLHGRIRNSLFRSNTKFSIKKYPSSVAFLKFLKRSSSNSWWTTCKRLGYLICSVIDFVNLVLRSKESPETAKVNTISQDLSAAFDIVDYEKLLAKLRRMKLGNVWRQLWQQTFPVPPSVKILHY